MNGLTHLIQNVLTVRLPAVQLPGSTVFTRESSYCFQRVLAIAIHGWISQKRCKLELPNLHLRLPGRL